MGRRNKNTFSKALGHLKSRKIDEKIQMLSERPANSTMGYMTAVGSQPNPDFVSTQQGQESAQNLVIPDFTIGENPSNTAESYDTSGLFEDDGTLRVASPPGDNSYILGPMAAMWYAWANQTRIGYIKQANRQMQNLGYISGKLSDWDGSSGAFNSYGQLTLAQAQWFRTIQKQPGATNDPDSYNYRAYYPGPPSNTPDAFGRYYCVVTGQPKQGDELPGVGEPEVNPGEGGPQDPDSIFSAIMARLKKGERLSKAEEEFLRSQGLDDFVDGGKTGSPLGELALLGMSLAAAKAMLMTLGAIGPSFAKLMANEWSKRTLSDAAYKTFLQTGKMPPGIQGWRPFKALFTLKMLKTGPTPGARRALEAMFYSIIAKFSSSERKKYQNEINEYKNKLGIKEDPEDVPVATPVSPKGLDPTAIKAGYNDPHTPVNPDGHYTALVSSAQEILSAEMDAEYYGALSKGESPNYNNASINKAKETLKKAKEKSENWNKWKKENNYKWKGPIPKEDKVSTPTPVKDDQGTFDDEGNYIPPGYEDAIKTNEIGKPEIDPFKNEIKPGLGAGGDGQQLAMATYGGKVDPWDKILNDIDKASDKLKNQPEKDYPYHGRPGRGMGDRWKVQNNMSNLMTASYQRKGRVLSESRKSDIIKNLKKPVVIPETKQKSYKVKPKIKTLNTVISKPVATPEEYKPPMKMWGRYEYNQNVRASQERKNEVMNLLGEGEAAMQYRLKNGTTRTEQEMKEFWGKHPELYDFYFNNMNHRMLRKEQVEGGDFVVFLVDENGIKVSMSQSKLNEKLAEAEDQKLLDEYNKLNPKSEPISYEKDPLFKKVSSKLKPVINYPKKPSSKGYPDKAPPKLVNGFHPDLGKRYKYDKLDPHSAEGMPPQGNPEIDANIEKFTDKNAKIRKIKNLIGKKS